MVQGENGRLLRQAAELRREALLLYQSHSADPEVKAAIRDLNRARQPRLVLGPVSGVADYRKRLRSYDLDLLHEKGVSEHPSRQNFQRFALAAEQEVVHLHVEAQRLEKALALAESRGRAGIKTKAALLHERREKAAEELAREKGSRKQQLKAMVGLLDNQIRRLPPESDDLDAAGREAAEKIASARADYVQAIGNLRRAVDAVPEARRAAEADEDVHAAVRNLGQPKVPQLAEIQQALAYLAKVEPTLPPALPAREAPKAESARAPTPSDSAMSR